MSFKEYVNLKRHKIGNFINRETSLDNTVLEELDNIDISRALKLAKKYSYKKRPARNEAHIGYEMVWSNSKAVEAISFFDNHYPKLVDKFVDSLSETHVRMLIDATKEPSTLLMLAKHDKLKKEFSEESKLLLIQGVKIDDLREVGITSLDSEKILNSSRYYDAPLYKMLAKAHNKGVVIDGFKDSYKRLRRYFYKSGGIELQQAVITDEILNLDADDVADMFNKGPYDAMDKEVKLIKVIFLSDKLNLEDHTGMIIDRSPEEKLGVVVTSLDGNGVHLASHIVDILEKASTLEERCGFIDFFTQNGYRGPDRKQDILENSSSDVLVAVLNSIFVHNDPEFVDSICDTLSERKDELSEKEESAFGSFIMGAKHGVNSSCLKSRKSNKSEAPINS